ncbi:hypothetical protein HPB48_018749 [Haemaphysalis longicornis]|uniref:Uncharacterized protein n=1 Tax=Haemaphysalis longicornis TaxID=44386 RepID=A0A9J6GQP8_HAELO|nr:hypothetical protein HPB48_018749 [Haemaphysalis longicornis]
MTQEAAVSPARGRKQRLSTLGIATTALLGIALALFLIVHFALHKSSGGDRSKRGQRCHSEGCSLHASLIEVLVNKDIDPCEDFNAYACHGWSTYGLNHRTQGLGIMNLALDTWTNNFRENIEKAVDQIPSAKHVLHTYDSCMADSSKDESRKGVAQIRQFMIDLRLPWPEEPLEGLDPLEVLIDVGVNWGLGIWFDISLFGDPIRGERMVFYPASLIRVWSSITEELDDLRKHESVWTNLHDYFAPDLPETPHHVVEHTKEVHDNVYALVREAMISKSPTPIQILLQYIEVHTPKVTPARWAKAINASVKGRREILLSDNVTFMDLALLRVMGVVFSRYSNAEILRHLSWTFAQIFSHVADRQLLTLKFGDRKLARAERHKFCATEVEAAYQWLPSSIVAATEFPPDRRATIDETLNNATQALISKLGGLSGTNAFFRHAVSGKLQNISVTLWPPDALLTREGLGEEYDAIFSNVTLSFTKLWISAMRTWQHYRYKFSYSRNAEHPRNFDPPIMRYNYVLNTVQIAMAALTPPWYYYNGTKAMTHGGLFFFYVLQLVRAFDAIGRRFDPEGTVSTSWLPAESNFAITLKSACLLGTGSEDNFPEIPAMEVAYAAFEASLTEQDRSLWVVDTLSEEQLFFVTACLTMCGLDNVVRVSDRLDCNKAVANFPPFSKAFQCPDNSKMNPRNKCPFFN